MNFYRVLTSRRFYFCHFPGRSHLTIPAESTYSPSCIFVGKVAFMNRDLSVNEILINNRNDLKKNIARRNLQLNVDQICSQYERLCQLGSERVKLELARTENAELMKLLLKDSERAAENEGRLTLIEKLKARGRDLKHHYKSLTDEPYSTLEHEVFEQVLKLPVEIAHSTPDSDQILYQRDDLNNNQSLTNVDSHLDICRRNGTMSKRHGTLVPPAYYLHGNIASLERHLVNHIHNTLRPIFNQFISPDMFKPYLTSCSNNEKHFMIPVTLGDKKNEEAGNYLVLSGVSPLSFLSQFAGCVIDTSELPLSLYSVGTGYTADFDKEFGLYTSSQSLCADLFSVCSSSYNSQASFEQMSHLICSFYKKFDLPIKIVRVCAHSLKPCESARIEVLVWSPAFRKYFPCASVCTNEDRHSRLLTIKHSTHTSDVITNHYVYTAYARMMHVSTVIACLLESRSSSLATCYSS